jgi:membrane protease YdiL (CAAX protease family)
MPYQLTTDSLTEISVLQCLQCNERIVPTDRFCGSCGKEVISVQENPTAKSDVMQILTPTLGYYFITLVLVATYGLTDIFPEGFEGLVVISAIDIVLVIIFWAFYFTEMKPLFSVGRINFGLMGLTMAGAAIAGILVTVLAEVIQFSIQDDVFYSTYLFEDTSNPFLWAVLFICVLPAIFEEVAFRGFLYSNLEKVTTAQGAIYITAFIFGIIHLAVISMIWLVPGGLIFAYLRMKYKTLWYGIVGHFTYNFTITVIDLWGILT